MMCQNSFHKIPLQLYVQSISQLIAQVKENTGHCKGFLSEYEIQLNAAFLSAEQTAAQLQSQFEQIMTHMEISNEKMRSHQTIFTYYDD